MYALKKLCVQKNSLKNIAQLAGAVEYTNCTSSEG